MEKKCEWWWKGWHSWGFSLLISMYTEMSVLAVQPMSLLSNESQSVPCGRIIHRKPGFRGVSLLMLYFCSFSFLLEELLKNNEALPLIQCDKWKAWGDVFSVFYNNIILWFLTPWPWGYTCHSHLLALNRCGDAI